MGEAAEGRPSLLRNLWVISWDLFRPSGTFSAKFGHSLHNAHGFLKESAETFWRIAGQMGTNVTGLFLLACLCDVLSVALLNQVYRLVALKALYLRWFRHFSLK